MQAIFPNYFRAIVNKIVMELYGGLTEDQRMMNGIFQFE